MGESWLVLPVMSWSFLCQGLGEARKVDEAFQLLESVEEGTAIGGPTLSAPLIYGLLNALTEAGQFLQEVICLSSFLCQYCALSKLQGSE